MAETLLSFGFQKLWDLLLREYDRFKEVDEQLTELKRDLTLLRFFLKDADAKKHANALVNNFVEEIKEIIFDAEDVIKTFLLKEETSGIRNSLRRFSKHRELASDMGGISKRISNVIRNMQTFGVKKIIFVGGEYSHPLQERQSEMRKMFPINNEENLVGLEENVKKLVGYLVEEEIIKVVSITGMGGIGKTTLARQVCNHERVKTHFDGVVWVCISQQFTRKYVWQTILQQLSSKHDEQRDLNMSEDMLQEKLCRLLETNKYLIVLDGMWKKEAWDRIEPAFPSKKGYWKVLLTSRYESVSLHADPKCVTLKPEYLTIEESWTLLQRITFPINDTAEFQVDVEMEEMGKKLIKHCGGLPLAVKVLGGLLAAQYTLSDWKRVCENIGSHLVGGTSFNDRNISSVFHILCLSFEELPSYLKQCFLYLAHFPRDYTIDVGELSYYWAAEGIPRPMGYDGASIREVAYGYIEELVKRNMVISVRDKLTSRFETCHLHEMMREISLLKAKEENFVQIVDASTLTATSRSSCKSRRLVIHSSDVATHMKGFVKNPKLRSLLIIKQLWGSNWMASGLSFTRLKLMRVLDLSTVEFEGGKLPSSIGKLIHLRYLSLYHARVSHLPSSMRNLKLLLYLNLNVEVGSPLYVPNILNEMQELRYLCLPDEIHDKAYLELSNLINLETLENFSMKHSSMRDLLGMTRLKTLSNLFTGGCTRKILSSYLDELRHIENITIRDHSAATSEALLDSTTYEAMKENPFCNPGYAVTTKMLPAATTKYRKEMTEESECILVFSCNDSHDMEESHFMEAILRELCARAVTPLTYNLSGRENLNADMLNRSSVGIMVLSYSYVSSKQSVSLDHLVAIMEHWKAKGLVIIPTYFKVTLEDICGLNDTLEEDFLQLQSSVQADRVQKWKTALAELASIDGHEWKNGTQAMLAEEVVKDACLRLYLKDSKNLVRILASLNKSHSSDAEIVGIWGMAGIGKTSIAREIFRILAPQYDLCYFLKDFDLTCQKKGVRQMRDDFFSKIFGEEKLSISATDVKPSFMRNWFHKKTILVVLDDVSNARDVEAVVGGFGWFSHGHRIILTSRRKQVLIQCKIKEPYEIHKLWDFESSRFCKQYLNEENAVIAEVMRCSSGIPLALEVLGSSVSKQHRNNMKEHLKSLRRNPPSQIQEAFRRSFDELDENEKNIFLDLACFFTGENKDHVVQLLDACGFYTYLGISDLIDESLISLVDNKIKIPIPFQDMGRFIVHEEDEDPSEQSRLWDSNDIVNVLKNNSGTEAIEGIFLDASDLICDPSPSVFSNMYRLRLLKFYCSTSGSQCKLSLSQGLDTLPDELRLLHWENYPLKCLPENFNPENLVEVNMPYSNMEKLWEGKKNLKKLKKIKLSHSRNLTDIMVLSEALNLEHIDLEGCTTLVDVSTSIPSCGNLVSLNMKDCSRLRSLPAMCELTSLEILSMSGCSELEEIQDFAPNLKELYLAGTAIRELPLSIVNLTKLVTLDLENCIRLQKLPNGIRTIGELKLSGCTSLDP